MVLYYKSLPPFFRLSLVTTLLYLALCFPFFLFKLFYCLRMKIIIIIPSSDVQHISLPLKCIFLFSFFIFFSVWNKNVGKCVCVWVVGWLFILCYDRQYIHIHTLNHFTTHICVAEFIIYTRRSIALLFFYLFSTHLIFFIIVQIVIVFEFETHQKTSSIFGCYEKRDE